MMFLVELFAAEEGKPNYLGFVLVGIAALVLMMMNVRRKRRPPELRPRSHERSWGGETNPASPPADMHKLLVQMQDLTREVEGRLDTKIRYAAKLLEEQRAEGDRLQRLIEEARGIGTAASPPAPAAEAGGSRAKKKVAEAASATPAPSPSESAQATKEREAVRKLYESGLGVAEIARKLDRPRGEIELMLALEKKTGWRA